MKFTRNDLKVAGAAEVAHVVVYLEQLAQALKAGTAHVRQGDQQIVLGPAGVVGFSLAASDRGKRQSLTLELTWRKRNVPAADLDLHFGPQVTAADAVEVEPSPAASIRTGAPGAELDTVLDIDKGEAHEGEALPAAARHRSE